MFNIYTLLYFPIACFIFFFSLGISTSISIKYDKRYERINIKRSLIDNIMDFTSGTILLIFISFIPFINAFSLIVNLFSISKFQENVIENRIKKGTLRKVEGE